MVKKKTTTKKKKNIKLPGWRLYVNTTFNNTLITLTDEQWNKVTGGGTWIAGFKWTKQSTPYAAEVLTSNMIKEAKENFWLKEIWIIVKGLWLARDWVFKAINDVWWVEISYIREETPVQFGWCKWVRPKRN